jgi:adenosylcobinamide-phosphate synthase
MHGHALAVALAVILDAWLGEPVRLYRLVDHPVVLIGRLAGGLERWLLDPAASARRQRLAGCSLFLLVVAAALAAGLLLTAVCSRLPAGWVIEGALLSSLIAWRSLVDHVREVAAGLRVGLEEARRRIARIVGRDPDTLDAPGVARAAIESLAENLSDGVVAPLLVAALGGLPAALVYKAVNTLDSMVGHKSARYRHFGWASARADDLLNLVPARATGLALVAAAIFAGADGRGAWRAMRRDAGRHRSPNAGWPEAAMAGALGLRLAGPRVYGGVRVDDAWMGDGRADAAAVDIDRALGLARRAYWPLAALVVLVSAGLG